MSADWWFGSAIMIVGVAGALLLMMAGAIVLLRAGLRLGDRLLQSTDLPLGDELDALDVKIAGLQERIDDFPSVIERARRAFVSLRSARTQAAALGESLNVAAQLISSIIAGPDKRRS